MLLYEQRSPRWVHVVCLVPTIGLVALFTDLVFLPDVGLLPLETEGEIDLMGKLIFGFFTFVGIFLIGVFSYRLVKNPWTFRMTDEGFEYNPAGVSSGFIRWEDVAEIKYVPVMTNRGGPTQIMTVGVILKDPHSYIARYPTALGALFEYRKYESETPLVFLYKEFGRDHDRVVAMMKEQVAKANARR